MNSEVVKVQYKKKWTMKRVGRYVAGGLVGIFLLSSLFGYFKPLPEGISYEGEVHQGDVDLLIDLTYSSEDGTNKDQVIFDHIHDMINGSEEFILVDMFLFNDDYDRGEDYPPLAQDLVDALVEKKKEYPSIEIVVMTDPINSFYGSYQPEPFNQLEEYGIHLLVTDLTALRDSNPAYSGFWRAIPQWFGNSENGWLPNPFSPDAPEGTIRSYLKLLNFKANHRKVVINEKEGFVTSANPHDASGYHSNIGFVLRGNILEDLVESERAVAEMSGASEEWFDSFVVESTVEEDVDLNKVQIITEGKIKEHLIEEIGAANEDDTIYLGAFYLSDRKIIKELLKAADREVDVRLILDANKDAFGREKNGVPNRPVAYELMEKSDGKVQVRWYNTSGEQYHTKLMMIDKPEEAVLIGGSANFTKRNLGDLNLETNVKVVGDPQDETIVNARDYFTMLWTNDGAKYTLDYEEYKDDSRFNRWLYRFQEWSGLSTF
ncbi:phospholipase D family protein [Alteribacter populi]|uniref:phospholipase D family protein n=1 Tax=Alteribacter populi TaxID=2011011 RepID=UPI001FE12075|nr:phospholipase D family protein [Alteribacter populi]